MTDNHRPLSDTFLQPPPPLPPRQKSVPSNIAGNRKRSASDLSVRSTPSPAAAAASTSSSSSSLKADQDDLALYYAHLHKHVREIKRADLSKLARPKLEDFKRTQDGVTTVLWKQFAEAWLFYILDSFASDQVDDQLEPFSLNILKSGLDRLYTIGEPLKEPALTVRRIYRWENVLLTGSILLIYSVLWYHDLLIVCLPLALVGYIILIRADQLAQFGVEALSSTSETMATAASSLGNDNDNDDNDGNEASSPSSSRLSDKSWQFWKRMRSDMGTQVHYGFAAFEKKSMNEWRSDIYKVYGPKGQQLLLDTVDRLERLKNLITWKRPEKTRLLLCILVAFSLLVAVIPVRYTVKLFYLYLGLEFFCLQALRSHYPKYRRLFNALDWLLWGIPNDAEYAMQVIRLRRQQEAPAMPKPTNSSSASRVFGRKSASDLRPSDDNHQFTPGGDSVFNPAPGKATSTAATLAAMMAGAAAGQIKQTLDEHLLNATSQQQQQQQRRNESSSNLFERKMSRDIDTDQEDIQVLGSYGCVYRGSIPGRIIISPKAFQFRTSRMTGGRVLVHYNWNDVTGIKKTKSIDVLLWHTNGLTITTTDGEELTFDNVIKRDDCFNMAAAAGEHWKRS